MRVFELTPVDRVVSADLGWTRAECDERAWAEEGAVPRCPHETGEGIHIVLTGREEHRLLVGKRSKILLVVGER